LGDWFKRLTGFEEPEYHRVRDQLHVENGRLHSRVNGASYGVGELHVVSLADLRSRVEKSWVAGNGLKLGILRADVRELHRQAGNAGALFQVASQFNMLEMTGPRVSPEDGVTKYAWDATQGPACAIAAGAGTIYRNYFVPVADQVGQTACRQIDCLSDLGPALSRLTGLSVPELWTMQNGYALGVLRGLRAIGDTISQMGPADLQSLKDLLRIGLQLDVEVTDQPELPGLRVSQAFCSAMPLGYSDVETEIWQPLARLVLDAAYEATLAAAILNAERTGSKSVFLTLVGAGAFGNPRAWVLDAIRKALQLYRRCDLNIRIVSHGEPPPDVLRLVADFDQ